VWIVDLEIARLGDKTVGTMIYCHIFGWQALRSNKFLFICERLL